MEILEAKELITKANGKAVTLNGLLPPVYGWDEFIQKLHYNYHQPNTSESPFSDFSHGEMQKRHNFYTLAFNPTEQHFPGLETLIGKLNEITDRPCTGRSTLANFIGGEPEVEVHFDIQDHLYWQVIGTSEWRIYKEKDGPYISHPLEPGDAIWVPHHTLHTIITPVPRAAFTFGWIPFGHKPFWEN